MSMFNGFKTLTHKSNKMCKGTPDFVFYWIQQAQNISINITGTNIMYSKQEDLQKLYVRFAKNSCIINSEKSYHTHNFFIFPQLYLNKKLHMK